MTQASPTATADVFQTEAAPTRQPAQPDRGGFIWGTGRRKAAVARVRVRPVKDAAKPRYLINGREVDVYFTEDRDRSMVNAPLKVTETEGKVDIYVRCKGGGYAGQAGAVLLGLARALRDFDPQLEAALREHNLLTRDPREVERKKYGQPGARRRFQFSKR
jgi:small subunit ribosomal protein S9